MLQHVGKTSDICIQTYDFSNEKKITSVMNVRTLGTIKIFGGYSLGISDGNKCILYSWANLTSIGINIPHPSDIIWETNEKFYAIYRFEINIKDAAILGLVGAGGIGAPLIFAMNAFNWDRVGAILCGLVILVVLVEICSTKIRTKLARG